MLIRGIKIILLLMLTCAPDMYCASESSMMITPTQAFIYYFKKIVEYQYERAHIDLLNDEERAQYKTNLKQFWCDFPQLQKRKVELHAVMPEKLTAPNQPDIMEKHFRALLTKMSTITGKHPKELLENCHCFAHLQHDYIAYTQPWAKFFCIVSNIQFKTRMPVSLPDDANESMVNEIKQITLDAIDAKSAKLILQAENDVLEELWDQIPTPSDGALRLFLEAKRKEFLALNAIDEEQE